MRRPSSPLRLAADPAEAELVADEGISVAKAAKMIGCKPNTIRNMLRERLLEGNPAGCGRRRPGVRVRLQSVRAWIAQGARGSEASVNSVSQPPVKPVAHAAHREAVATLAKLGLV